MAWTANDLEPPLAGAVLDDGSAPVDLTTATAVVVHVRRPDGTVLGRQVTLADQATTPGGWSMPWQAGDLAQPGAYLIEVEVMWPLERPQTFGRHTIQVERELVPGPVVPPESPPGSGLFLTSLIENPVDSGLYEMSI